VIVPTQILAVVVAEERSMSRERCDRWGLKDREGVRVKAKREPLRNISDGRVLRAGRACFA
jgi:hypothetical protein